MTETTIPTNVIELEEFKVRRVNNISYPGSSNCPHDFLEMDDAGEIIRCVKCKSQVSAYWALKNMAEAIGRARATVKAQYDALQEEKKKDVVLLAALLFP